MPFYKKKKNYKKHIIFAIVIALIVLMIISFSPNIEMTEVVLFP